jgi:hypothetical protein
MEKLILSLIKDDLIHTKLVTGLQQLGLKSDNYFLNLGDTIFNLMGFEDNAETETIYERYMELTRRSLQIDISQSHKAIEHFAMEIYKEILSRKSGL